MEPISIWIHAQTWIILHHCFSVSWWNVLICLKKIQNYAYGLLNKFSVLFLSWFVAIVVQSLSCVWLFMTPWTACQATLSFTDFRSLLKLMSTESVVLPNHLILLVNPFSSGLQSFPASGFDLIHLQLVAKYILQCGRHFQVLKYLKYVNKGKHDHMGTDINTDDWWLRKEKHIVSLWNRQDHYLVMT